MELGQEKEGELDSGRRSRPINLATRLGVFVPGESMEEESSVLVFVAVVLICRLLFTSSSSTSRLFLGASTPAWND